MASLSLLIGYGITLTWLLSDPPAKMGFSRFMKKLSKAGLDEKASRRH